MADPNKPGIKTSEFWVALLAPALSGIVVGVGNYFGLDIPADTIYAGIATGLGYIFNRAYVKGAVAKANAPQQQ